MRSKQLNFNAYDTDKIKLHYLEVYDQILVPWIGKAITFLEIGVSWRFAKIMARLFLLRNRGLNRSETAARLSAWRTYSDIRGQPGGRRVSVESRECDRSGRI